MYRLIAALALVAQAAFGTIIIAVGTRDGLLVCEDRRLTVKSSDGRVTTADGNKAQQLGKFGVYAITGDVSGGLMNIFGRSITTFDLASAIPSFFARHDVQRFDEPMALEFEADLRDQLTRKPADPAHPAQGPRARTEVLLYWMDQAGVTHLYIVDITDALSDTKGAATPGNVSVADLETAAPHPVGNFVSLSSFRTSKPLVRGKGAIGYAAIAAGTDSRFEDLRQDDELKPFLSKFTEAESVDPIAAVRSIKKLIREISNRQDSLNPDGLDVGPVSDCFLGTPDGIKNIDQ
ncbi:MAG TPA: hypothetical protein VGR73_18425 [Bryobacteraceae bacterium]|nr:hypothetical protein [Bryobacteraceae bacterium]